MADDLFARIAELEAELRQLRDEGAIDRAEIATLREQRDASNAGRDTAREQQVATAEVLSVIASSPRDRDAALTMVAKRAARLTDAAGAASVITRSGTESLYEEHGHYSAQGNRLIAETLEDRLPGVIVQTCPN